MDIRAPTSNATTPAELAATRQRLFAAWQATKPAHAQRRADLERLRDTLRARIPAMDAAIRADYAARVLSLKPRFDLYEEANRANAHPWLVDLLVWSARRSPRRVQRMAGVLEETHIPTDAVSVRGVLRRLVDWR